MGEGGIASAGEVLCEPHDQVVVHGSLHPFAERLLAPARSSAVRNVAALSVQPLSRAVLVEQADGDAQRGDAPLAGQLLGRVHQQRGNPLPPEWSGDGDLVDQRNPAVPESGKGGLPQDRGVTDDIVTARGDKAGALRFCVIGQVSPRLGLAAAYPLDKELDDASKLPSLTGWMAIPETPMARVWHISATWPASTRRPALLLRPVRRRS